MNNKSLIDIYAVDPKSAILEILKDPLSCNIFDDLVSEYGDSSVRENIAMCAKEIISMCQNSPNRTSVDIYFSKSNVSTAVKGIFNTAIKNHNRASRVFPEAIQDHSELYDADLIECFYTEFFNTENKKVGSDSFSSLVSELLNRSKSDTGILQTICIKTKEQEENIKSACVSWLRNSDCADSVKDLVIYLIKSMDDIPDHYHLSKFSRHFSEFFGRPDILADAISAYVEKGSAVDSNNFNKLGMSFIFKTSRAANMAINDFQQELMDSYFNKKEIPNFNGNQDLLEKISRYSSGLISNDSVRNYKEKAKPVSDGLSYD